MNNLIFMFYLRDIVGMIGGLSVFFGLVITTFSVIIYFMGRLENMEKTEEEKNNKLETLKFLKRIIIIGVTSLVIGLITPTKEFITIAIGLKVAEKTVETISESDIYKDIKSIIISEIKELKKDNEKK